MKNRKMFLSWLSLALSAVLVAGGILYVRSFAPPRVVTRIPQTGLFLDPSKFIAGVNYPWYHYGSDFGTTAWGHEGVSDPASTAAIEKDFAYLQSQNVLLVRWFVFCDGRAGLIYGKDGMIFGPDDYLFPDMDAAIKIADEHNIHLMFVVSDFLFFNKEKRVNGVKLGGHADIATDPAKRQAFLDKALKPMLERYANNPTVVAWEVINEPEWAMQIPIAKIRKLVSNPIPFSTMQGFVADQIRYVHMYAHQPATVGSAMRNLLPYWTNVKVDFYDFHYYPYMEIATPYDLPAAKLNLDKPLLIGEIPTNNGFAGIQDYLRFARINRYAGALAWSLRGTDKYSAFKQQGNAFRDWQKRNPFLPDWWLPAEKQPLRPGITPAAATVAPAAADSSK